MNLVLILGNQLFPLPALRKVLPGGDLKVFMREDRELCTHYRYHKHKIIFFLAAMRAYRDELEEAGLRVHYESLGSRPFENYEASLADAIQRRKIRRVFVYEIEDKFFERRLFDLLRNVGVDVTVWPSPMFLTSRPHFESYLRASKKPFMKVFYEQQRKRLKILVDRRLEPVGGSWSFDSENRLPLRTGLIPPSLHSPPTSPHAAAVQELVTREFGDHPGKADDFFLPVDRAGALEHLQKFFEERFAHFGPYEDAMPPGFPFVYHSVLTPFLNTGLLTPAEVVSRALDFADRGEIPLASLEGFIRQIIGWREFVRGIYQNFSEKQDNTNFFGHRMKLTPAWYDASTGVAPLDATIGKALRYAYGHHIERLMVVGNLMLLLEIAPTDAHRWFMEMYLDSSDWVMGPNVYGMALFSDGGIFATKPYICGSNYYRKMGGYKATEAWCDGVDGLYWGFLERHREKLGRNPRLSMIFRSLEKMDAKKKKRIYAAADSLRGRLST